MAMTAATLAACFATEGRPERLGALCAASTGPDCPAGFGKSLPQYRQTIASSLIISAQNGHFFIPSFSVMLPSCALH
jgi:hypothetical protein